MHRAVVRGKGKKSTRGRPESSVKYHVKYWKNKSGTGTHYERGFTTAEDRDKFVESARKKGWVVK